MMFNSVSANLTSDEKSSLNNEQHVVFSVFIFLVGFQNFSDCLDCFWQRFTKIFINRKTLQILAVGKSFLAKTQLTHIDIKNFEVSGIIYTYIN